MYALSKSTSPSASSSSPIAYVAPCRSPGVGDDDDDVDGAGMGALMTGLSTFSDERLSFLPRKLPRRLNLRLFLAGEAGGDWNGAGEPVALRSA